MLLNAARELYWLTRHWKQISIPLVAYEFDLEHSGEYWHPDDEGILRFAGMEAEIPNGAIVLGSDPGPGTMAHEFRHHLQFLRGVNRPPAVDPWAPKREYFACPNEADALGFELRFAPEWLALTWAEELRVTPPSRSALLDWRSVR